MSATLGLRTLLRKEILRFWKVTFQTIAAPVLTAVLYLLIFGHVLEGRLEVHGLAYGTFLLPGLVMMSVLQNAFANSSSSLIQSKVTGNLVFLLLTPLDARAWSGPLSSRIGPFLTAVNPPTVAMALTNFMASICNGQACTGHGVFISDGICRTACFKMTSVQPENIL